MILLEKTLPTQYQILKSLSWVSLFDKLLELGVDPLLVPKITTATHNFVFSRRISLRLILFWEKVVNVFS